MLRRGTLPRCDLPSHSSTASSLLRSNLTISLKNRRKYKLFPSFQPDPAMHPHHWHRSHELLHALRLGREGCHFYDDDEEDEDDDDVENDDDVEC